MGMSAVWGFHVLLAMCVGVVGYIWVTASAGCALVAMQAVVAILRSMSLCMLVLITCRAMTIP